jgi:hypothetical protein
MPAAARVALTARMGALPEHRTARRVSGASARPGGRRISDRGSDAIWLASDLELG